MGAGFGEVPPPLISSLFISLTDPDTISSCCNPGVDGCGVLPIELGLTSCCGCSTESNSDDLFFGGVTNVLLTLTTADVLVGEVVGEAFSGGEMFGSCG